MDLVGSIIAWVIGLPVALILGCVLGVGAFFAHQKYTGNPVVSERMLWISFVAVLACCFGIVCLLGCEWLLLAVFFTVPLILGNIMGVSKV